MDLFSLQAIDSPEDETIVLPTDIKGFMICEARRENKEFRTPRFYQFERVMANLLLRDLAIANVVALALAVVLFGIGWSLINAISISLLVLCAILLIFGGALGFFLSSSSFDWLLKIFRISEKQEEESEAEKRRPKIKTKAEERKEQVDAGKRIIFIGFIMLGESLILSLVYILM